MVRLRAREVKPVAERMRPQKAAPAVRWACSPVQPVNHGPDWRRAPHYTRDAAAYPVPRDLLGSIPHRSARLTLRPSQVPARLAPDDDLRAGMQAELSGTPFRTPVETSHMQAQTAQPHAWQSGTSSPATLRLLSRVQPRLMARRIGDPLEDEADRVADQVMRIPGPQIAAGSPRLSRKCSSCEEEEQDQAQRLQAKRDMGRAAGGDAPAVVAELLGSPGRPLEASARGFMEPRLGRDLSDVRIHTGPLASRSAEAVTARAYTVGHDVVFRNGEYAPDTTEGRRLLAHELAHVLQQRPAQPAPRTLRPSQVTAVGNSVQRQDDAPQSNTSSDDYNAGYQDAATGSGESSPGDRGGQALDDYNAGFAAGLAASTPASNQPSRSAAGASGESDTGTGPGASNILITDSSQIAGQLTALTGPASVPVGGQRLCFPPSMVAPTDQWASGFGTLAERYIEQDYCGTFSCIPGPAGTVYIDNYNPIEYINFLKAHNPSLTALSSAAELAAFVAGGIQRPDILSDDGMRKEYYEIKPLSPSGAAAGVEKLAFIASFMAILGLPYRAGTTYSPSKDIPIMSGTVLGEPLAVSLNVQRWVPGIITYSLCLSGNLVEILAKVTLAVLLAWIAAEILAALAAAAAGVLVLA
jgi:Domain of unknown function (DUF4157)